MKKFFLTAVFALAFLFTTTINANIEEPFISNIELEENMIVADDNAAVAEEDCTYIGRYDVFVDGEYIGRYDVYIC